MVQRTLDRLWQRLTNRYEQDDTSDCCGPTIEDVSSDASETESECGCE